MQLLTSIPLFSSITLVTSIYKEETNETEKKEKKEETSEEVQPEQIVKVIRKEVKEQEDNAWKPNPDIRPRDSHPWEDEFREDHWTTTTSSRAVQDTLGTQENKQYTSLEG